MYLITKITPTKKIGFNNIYLNGSYYFTVCDFTLASFKLKENLNVSIEDLEQILTIELTERFKNYCLNILASRPRSEKELEQKIKLRIRKYKEEWPVFGNLQIKSEKFKVKKNIEEGFNKTQENVDTSIRVNDFKIINLKTPTNTLPPINPDQKFSSTSKLEFLIEGANIEKIFSTAKNDAFEFLKKYDYLNEKQFAIWLVNQRLNQGKGKLFIKQDLFSKGVSKEIIADVLKNIDFSDSIQVVYQKAIKKYSNEKIPYKRKQKIYRYLLSRGFSFDEITRCLNID